MANTSNTSGSAGQFGAERALQTATAATERAKETAAAALERARETAASAADKARNVASAATERARELATNVGHRAQDMASQLGHRAEETRSAVGDQMKSLAGNIRAKAPHDGMTGRTAEAVAGGLESGGSYLQAHNLGDMAGDMANVVRRYPLQSVLIGIGLGFLLARLTRS